MKTFNGVQIQYKEIGYAGGRKIGGKADIVNGTPVIYLDRQALSEKWNEKAWKNPLRSDFIGIVDFKSENDLITWTLLHELGHIKYDEVKGERIPFDEREIAQKALALKKSPNK